MYVIDASVHVADARPEETRHPEANALLARLALERWPVFAPMVVLAEVAAGLAHGTGQPELALRWVFALRRLPHFRFVPLDYPLGELAAELAARQRIRGCDAIYVALAQSRKATLITLDRQQLERAPPQVSVRTPAEELAAIQQRDKN